MFKKGKINKLNYQIAFEFRSLKWFVLEIVMFSVFLELIYMYFKTKNLEESQDIYFHTFISGGLWEVLFYLTMVIGIVGVGKLVGGEKKGYNSMMTLRVLPLSIKDMVLSKVIVAVVSILAIYGAQLLSFMFAWSLFAESVPTAKRVSHALNYALVKDNFIYACFPSNFLHLLVNIVVLCFLVIGSTYMFYAVRTGEQNKIVVGGMFLGTQLVAMVLLMLLKVRVPFIHFPVDTSNGSVAVVLSIIGVVYLALNVLTCVKMYSECHYEA